MYNVRVAAGAEFGYVETDPTCRYGRFDEVLGKGAMKTVYKAIDEKLGMEVAWNQIKLNDVLNSPEELQRVHSEVHLLSTLNHDSLIRFYTSWIDVDNKCFNFITEMFTSGTLREYRKRYRRVDIRAIKSWARQILRGLVYLHCHDPPVIHRDLKCDNIFVNGHLGQVKIGDLGLAAILRGRELAHSIIGTPEFIAPELYDENYNELVDVYSFGMCVIEMLTSEYPYSECNNPAQIYKKVTSGKLPDAFFRIEDLEARKFVGKCLANVLNRLSAKELLGDPFLTSDEARLGPLLRQQKPLLNEIRLLRLNDDPSRTNMTITGKLDSEDDIIFLKVQIADNDGPPRNIFFPFHILHDTPIDVAMEMVKELEITDWEPFEIADMIDGEISALVPNWKRWDQQTQREAYDAFSYQESDEERRHPFQSMSSCSSSQSSILDLVTSRRKDYIPRGSDCVQDSICDDDGSQCSSHTGKYANLNNFSGNEQESHSNPVGTDQYNPNAKIHRPTRFGPEERSSSKQSLAKSCYKRMKSLLDSNRGNKLKDRRGMEGRRLTRNRSLVDVRSQLLHRSLVEEVNKRRLSRTVGEVEHIGFQAPCDNPKKASHTSKSRTASKEKRTHKGRINNTEYSR